jgi:hypothetical protein
LGVITLTENRSREKWKTFEGLTKSLFFAYMWPSGIIRSMTRRRPKWPADEGFGILTKPSHVTRVEILRDHRVDGTMYLRSGIAHFLLLSSFPRSARLRHVLAPASPKLGSGIKCVRPIAPNNNKKGEQQGGANKGFFFKSLLFAKEERGIIQVF